MAGGDIDVDYDALEDTGNTLQELADEFNGMEDQMEGYGDAVAHERVAEELDRVGSNWSDDREEITEKMQNAAEYATQAAAAYRDLDTGLANEYSGAGGGGGGSH